MQIRSLDPLGVKKVQVGKGGEKAPVFGSSAPDAFSKATGTTNSAPATAASSLDLSNTDMKQLQKRGVLVVGANGTMGKEIMQNARTGGFNVIAQEQEISLALNAVEDTTRNIAKAKSNGFVKEKQFQEIMTNTTAQVIDGKKVSKAGLDGGYKAGDIPNAGLVVEAIFENLPIKQSLFANLEKLLPEDTILATNTSSLSVNDIGKNMKHPERLIGLHYFWPAVSNQLIEIIPGNKTSPEVIDKTMKFARSIGKIPVLVGKDSPGFVANRLLVSVVLEGLHLFEEGYGDAKTIDKIANQIMWEKASGYGFAQKDLLPPFAFIKNPKYTSLGPEIIGNLSKLGKHMQAPAFIMDEHNRVQNLIKGPLRAARTEQAAAEAKLEALERQRTALEATLPMDQADAQVKALDIDAARAEAKALEKKTEAIEKEAQYYPKGFSNGGKKAPGTPAEHAKIIENRLYGIIYGTALQMVAEGLCKPEDIDNISRLGFKWEMAPFESMQKRGQAKVNEALEAMTARYGKDFAIPPMVSDPVSYAKTEFNAKTGALTVRLDRVQPFAGKHNFNTLGTPTLNAIKQAIEAANTDPAVKAIVFEGNGGNIFSGGANLDELAETKDKAVINQYIRLGREVMDTVAASPKLTVAKVQGNAYGGGVELALACDRIIASEDAKFTLPEVDLGIYPAWGGTERLPEKVGKPFAKALILTGKNPLGMFVNAEDRKKLSREQAAKKFPAWVCQMVNSGLGLGLDISGGLQLDAKTGQRLGLIHAVMPRVGLDEATDRLLADPAFTHKHTSDSPDASSNPRRGLTRFPNAASYPADIQAKFHLNDIEKYSHSLTGRYNRDSWALANRLIDAAGTPEAGKTTAREISTILDNAAARKDKVMEFGNAAIANMDKKYLQNAQMMLAAMLLDWQSASGLYNLFFGPDKTPKPDGGKKS